MKKLGAARRFFMSCPHLAGISLSMYCAFTLGVLMWLLSGLALGEWPIIVANSITLGLAATILLRTWRSRRQPGA